MHIVINNKNLTYKNYKVKCSIGKRGIGSKRKEGDLITPKGKFKIKFILYRKDRVKNIQTKIRKIVIRKNIGWCDDSNYKDYIPATAAAGAGAGMYIATEEGDAQYQALPQDADSAAPKQLIM